MRFWNLAERGHQQAHRGGDLDQRTKHVPGDPKNPTYANTVDWPTMDGTENILVGNLDILNQQATNAATKSSGEQTTAPKTSRP